MDQALEFLGSAAGIAILITAAIFLWDYFKNKSPKFSKYEPLLYKAFNWVEKSIKDGQGGVMGKLDLFLKEFAKAYEKKYGKEPSSAVLEYAEHEVERLVYSKNLTRNHGAKEGGDGNTPNADATAD